MGATVSGFIEDWRRCVKNLTVSSRENTSYRLTDGSNFFWESAGHQGKVRNYNYFFAAVVTVKLINIIIQIFVSNHTYAFFGI